DDCKKEHASSAEELYCLCKTPYDESKFYIGCDRCQDWFHGTCVGITKSQADSIDVYICPNCQANNSPSETKANQTILTTQHFIELRRIVKSLQSHKMSWPFLEAVDPEEVPDYYRVIKEPMDLTTVEDRVSRKQYMKLGDYVRDVMRIFDNCRYYNTADSPFYQCAEVMESYFVQKLKAFKERL
ncbi:unnamed protein product, partial [Owenia fusiformis]